MQHKLIIESKSIIFYIVFETLFILYHDVFQFNESLLKYLFDQVSNDM